ncbi:PIN2/TERF1-interacting telomerase inhibitor 1 isoform X1 [Drosophila bipectinata]|uniref:PIN2/TERF1-interacting telomerase inhibitor 1 isoform X1 n=1 Tax=Drosophila bipectinata TaxID=42026 RepID=UPI001C8B04C4|nr:PIN2/TERF1-interacting telomerase inhibitor 1 [Drosophila bipectinata]
MAMLAEPRRRKRYNLCPRGKALYEDDNRFGTKMLEKMGWSKGKGLGANEDGNQEFVRVKFKNDADGLGYEARDDQWTIHEEGFNGLLKSLNGGSSENNGTNGKESESEEEAKPMGFGFKAPEAEAPTTKKLKENISGMSLEERSKQSRARVHYKKFTRGKDLSQYSEKDLANIFGKKETSNVETPVQVEEPKEEKAVNPNFGGVQTLTTGVSVTDYFKQKMEAVKKRLKNGSANVATEDASNGNPEETTNGVVQEDNIEESDQVEPVKKKKKKKDKERKEDLPEEEEVVEPAPKQKKKKKSKSSPEEETIEQETTILEDKQESLEESNPPKRKKKKKSEKTEEPEETQNVAEEPVSKKKKKSEKHDEVEESQPVEEEPVPKKKKKSKRKESEDSVKVDDEPKPKKSEPINAIPQDSSQLESKDSSEEVGETSKKKKSKKRSKEEVEEIVVTETAEITSKKKKKSKASLESVPEDPSSEANPIVGEEATTKKPKDSKRKRKDEVSSASTRSDDNSEEELPKDLLSLEEIHERLKSFNTFTISQFCADKFQLFDLTAFPNSSLAGLVGYGFSENVDLKVVHNDDDKERIINLWKNKSALTRKEKIKKYSTTVKRATIRSVKKRIAFKGI